MNKQYFIKCIFNVIHLFQIIHLSNLIISLVGHNLGNKILLLQILIYLLRWYETFHYLSFNVSYINRKLLNNYTLGKY